MLKKEERRTNLKFVKLSDIKQSEDLDIDVRITLKWVVEKHGIRVPTVHSQQKYIFLSFILSPTSVYLTRLGVEGYYSSDHTQRHTTVGRTPLDEGSARRGDLYLTHTTFTTDKHPCPRRDSNPQSQQAIGCRPTS
jgi:hypothetical protein